MAFPQHNPLKKKNLNDASKYHVTTGNFSCGTEEI